jgi:hypothetical protein
MSKECRRSLFFLLSIAALLLFAVGASAQDCDTCDPYTNHCSDYCDRCTHQGIDGCDTWTASTCGHDHACLTDNCTANWSETSRVTQGTYEGSNWNSCNHHSVQWVTLTDSNHCNTSSTYWTHSYCDNVIDGSKSGFYPDCCDGYGPGGTPDSLYTCNGYHSCTG